MTSRPERRLIRTQQIEPGVFTLQLDDADGKNALSASMVRQLEENLLRLGEERELKVLIVCGLDDVFCSGGDKEMLLELARGSVEATDIMLSKAMLDFPLPTIAAMAGHAVGGGLALGACCDVVLMGDESRYGCSFMNMGFTPGMGTTRLLAGLVGDYLAAEMMYGGQFFRGRVFVQRTSVNYVVPKAKVFSKALSVARRIAEKPRPALELLKRSLGLKKRLLFEEARAVETMMHERCFSFAETQALIDENFVEE